jgi:hypothetical protein
LNGLDVGFTIWTHVAFVGTDFHDVAGRLHHRVPVILDVLVRSNPDDYSQIQVLGVDTLMPGTLVTIARVIHPALSRQLQQETAKELHGAAGYSDVLARVGRVVERIKKEMQSGSYRNVQDLLRTPVAFGYTAGGPGVR